ncbi:hypothetical protein PG991_007643 [Apiospora marii]|uniref:Uncharacterized protein n=2 Tax=Apiospora marii TaxID=335849 RepID=A0ABR1RW36_9PEZI
MTNAFTHFLALAATLGGFIGSGIAGPIPKTGETASALDSTAVVGEPLRSHVAVPVESTRLLTATAAPADQVAGDRGIGKDDTSEGDGTMATTGRGGYN